MLPASTSLMLMMNAGDEALEETEAIVMCRLEGGRIQELTDAVTVAAPPCPNIRDSVTTRSVT